MNGANQNIVSSEIFHSVLAVAKRRLFYARKERSGPIPGIPMDTASQTWAICGALGCETGVMPPSRCARRVEEPSPIGTRSGHDFREGSLLIEND
jgi:hypothetical protein